MICALGPSSLEVFNFSVLFLGSCRVIDIALAMKFQVRCANDQIMDGLGSWSKFKAFVVWQKFDILFKLIVE